MYFCNMIFRHLLNMRSHPTWVRGLKLLKSYPKSSQRKSHPTWVRGLKLHVSCNKPYGTFRRTLRGCVD